MTTRRALTVEIKRRAYPVAVTRCFRNIFRSRGAGHWRSGVVKIRVNLSSWRWLHFWRFHFSDFRFNFSNRFNLNFNYRLNVSFHFNFHYRLWLNGFHGDFNRLGSLNVFHNLFCDNHVFRGDDLRLFSHRRGNHFRM